MTRKHITLLASAALALLVVWIATQTYWEDVTIPIPPKGEAAVNPFYVVEHFAQALGARASWDRTLTAPPPTSTIVLSTWHWNLSRRRQDTLERWVESGGRLVVDDGVIDPSGAFERWSGIVRKVSENPARRTPCRDLHETVPARASGGKDGSAVQMCDYGTSWLVSSRTPEWALRDDLGVQAMRVRVGRGTVTVINGTVFVRKDLLEADHARIFASATELRRGDDLHFLSEDDAASLLALTWRTGAPVVLLGLALIAALVWRGAVRFGPLAPATVPARRSLADQIRGSGHFAVRHGSGQALHAASVRALEDSARRRVAGFNALSPRDRVAALARLTGFDRESLAAAIYDSRLRAPAALRRTIELLEAARRQILTAHTRLDHGTH